MAASFPLNNHPSMRAAAQYCNDIIPLIEQDIIGLQGKMAAHMIKDLTSVYEKIQGKIGNQAPHSLDDFSSNLETAKLIHVLTKEKKFFGYLLRQTQGDELFDLAFSQDHNEFVEYTRFLDTFNEHTLPVLLK